jgi:Domain of unknown function (DUF4340)
VAAAAAQIHPELDMSRRRFLSLLIAAFVVISGAIFFSTQRNQPHESLSVSLLPTLATELDSVTELALRKGGAIPIATLHRVDGQWTVAERGDYPADVAKLRKMLLTLGDAKIVEEKTSNPANFSIIGVEDPTKPGATGTEITVSAKDGKHAVIVGKPVGNGNFARRGGENQSFIVEPAISVEAEPRSWIDSRLIEVPGASIQSVEIKPPAGAGYTVHRLKPNEDGFSLDGAPSGRKPADSRALAPSATMLAGLTAEDVAAASSVDFSKSSEAIVTLADGNVLTVIGTTAADKHWIQVKASKDTALTAKAQGRAFEVAAYRYDAIFRPLDQLLVPKESPAPSKTATPPAKPAAPGQRPAPVHKAAAP